MRTSRLEAWLIDKLLGMLMFPSPPLAAFVEIHGDRQLLLATKKKVLYLPSWCVVARDLGKQLLIGGKWIHHHERLSFKPQKT
jgi:hypothetical protein